LLKDTSVVTPVGLISVLLALAAGYQAITRGPAYIIAAIALSVFVAIRAMSVRTGREIVGLRGDSVASTDPWAKPSRRDRRLQRRALSLNLSLTELGSIFPSIAVRGVGICERLGYA